VIDDFADDLENLAVEYVDMPGALADEISQAYYQAYHAAIPIVNVHARQDRLIWRNA
jgi:hypothetical protein